MKPRPTQKEKTQRAFRAYLDLMDTADWLKSELRAPLEAFDLTMPGFRLLEMLYSEGAVTVPDAARRRWCSRQNLDFIIARLEERGLVRQMVVRIPPAAIKESRLPKARRAVDREGPKVSVVGLTKAGKKFIGRVLPRHAKMVKALMRALDGREQESISRVCRKLREGDPVKFFGEIMMMDEEEEAEELRQKAMAELERLTARAGMRRRAIRVQR